MLLWCLYGTTLVATLLRATELLFPIIFCGNERYARRPVLPCLDNLQINRGCQQVVTLEMSKNSSMILCSAWRPWLVQDDVKQQHAVVWMVKVACEGIGQRERRWPGSSCKLLRSTTLMGQCWYSTFLLEGTGRKQDGAVWAGRLNRARAISFHSIRLVDVFLSMCLIWQWCGLGIIY